MSNVSMNGSGACSVVIDDQEFFPTAGVFSIPQNLVAQALNLGLTIPVAELGDLTTTIAAAIAAARAALAKGTFKPADPSGTTSTSAMVMMGLGTTAKLTPAAGTCIEVTLSGQMANGTLTDGASVDLRYGTGTAPANGDAAAGTVVSAVQTRTSPTNGDSSGVSFTAIITGLTPGTAYWFDAGLKAVTGGTASLAGITMTAREF